MTDLQRQPCGRHLRLAVPIRIKYSLFCFAQYTYAVSIIYIYIYVLMFRHKLDHVLVAKWEQTTCVAPAIPWDEGAHGSNTRRDIGGCGGGLNRLLGFPHEAQQRGLLNAPCGGRGGNTPETVKRSVFFWSTRKQIQIWTRLHVRFWLSNQQNSPAFYLVTGLNLLGTQKDFAFF